MEQSKTMTIRRSQINLNPFNPKNHTLEQVKTQLKNIKKNGFLGGVLWNATSSNLIDGHRRVQALDMLHRYDGTEQTDYDIKVESVEFDPKTEKEQMTYMALGNSQADYNLVARYIDDIDPDAIGISEADYKLIQDLREVEADAMIEDLDYLTVFSTEETPRKTTTAAPVTALPSAELGVDEWVDERRKNAKPMSKEEVKAAKQHCADVAVNRQRDETSYVILSFAAPETKEIFCELLGVQPEINLRVSGEMVLSMIE